MSTNTLCRTGALALLACAVGCAPAHIPLKPTFWHETQRKIVVGTVALPELQAYKEGSSGLIDAAITSAMASGLEGYLKTLDARRFNTVADKFVEALKARGLNASRFDQPIALDGLPGFSTGAPGEFANKDFRSIRWGGSADLLVLLSLTQCGTTRNYYGFIPLGPPMALCLSKGELIDLKTNEVRWRTTMPAEQSAVTVLGEWDQSPNYPNITAAIAQAITNAQTYVFEDFFGPGAAQFTTPPVAGAARLEPSPMNEPHCTDTPEFKNATPPEKKRMLEECRQAQAAAATH